MNELSLIKAGWNYKTTIEAPKARGYASLLEKEGYRVYLLRTVNGIAVYVK